MERETETEITELQMDTKRETYIPANATLRRLLYSRAAEGPLRATHASQQHRFGLNLIAAQVRKSSTGWYLLMNQRVASIILLPRSIAVGDFYKGGTWLPLQRSA